MEQPAEPRGQAAPQAEEPLSAVPEKPAQVRYSQPAAAMACQLPPGAVPYQQPTFRMEPPRPSKTWSVAKLVLEAFTFVIDVVILAIAIAIVIKWSYQGETELIYIICFCVAGIALVWQIAEFITAFTRAGLRGIHPGAHVGMHLLIWLGWAVGIGMTSVVVADSLSAYDDYDYESDNYSYDYDFDAPSEFAAFVRVEEAALAFEVLAIIAHFVLFVLACIQTDRRNRAARLIYVVAPAGPEGAVRYVPAPGLAHAYYQQIPSETQLRQAGGAGAAPPPPPLPKPQSYYTMSGPYQQQAGPAPPPPARLAGPAPGPGVEAEDPGLRGYYAPAPPEAAVASGPRAEALRRSSA